MLTPTLLLTAVALISEGPWELMEPLAMIGAYLVTATFASALIGVFRPWLRYRAAAMALGAMLGSVVLFLLPITVSIGTSTEHVEAAWCGVAPRG